MARGGGLAWPLLACGVAALQAGEPAWPTLSTLLGGRRGGGGATGDSTLTRFLDGIETILEEPDSLSGLTCGPSAELPSICAHTCSYIHVKIGVMAELACLLSILLTLPVFGTGPPLMYQLFPRVCPVSNSKPSNLRKQLSVS